MTARRRATTPRAARTLLGALFDAAVGALEPRRLVRDVLARERRRLAPLLAAARRDGLVLVGAGKGAARIAAAVEAELAPLVRDGVVVVPPGYERALARVTVRCAHHPVPDRRSVAATRALVAMLARTAPRPVLVVITGGASSVLELPAAPLALADVQRTYALLLASGATIAETNCVRTHLSSVKGGRLAEHLVGRPAVALVLSDVPGDTLAVIGSGPTVPDPTTFADALAVARTYAFADRLPADVRRRLRRGAAGRVPETPKPSGAPSMPTLLLGGNGTARGGAVAAARARGCEPVASLRRPIVGAPATAAMRVAARLRALAARAAPGAVAVLVGGGETTVRLPPRARGRGGRNQELALEVARLLAGVSGWALLCAGSDGVDGPTDAAGAFVDGETSARAARAGFSLARALARHDVYPLLDAIGALHRPGPTGTNVADLVLAVVWRDRRWRVPRAV